MDVEQAEGIAIPITSSVGIDLVQVDDYIHSFATSRFTYGSRLGFRYMRLGMYLLSVITAAVLVFALYFVGVALKADVDLDGPKSTRTLLYSFLGIAPMGAALMVVTNRWQAAMLPTIRDSRIITLLLYGSCCSSGVLSANQFSLVFASEILSNTGYLVCLYSVVLAVFYRIDQQKQSGNDHDDATFMDILFLFLFAVPSMAWYYGLKYGLNKLVGDPTRGQGYQNVVQA